MAATATSVVKWNNSFSLGLDEIDDQHKTLIDVMNQVWMAIVQGHSPGQIKPVFDQLEQYTIVHFAEEETFMRAINYPNFDRHKQSHQEFIDRLAREKAAFVQGQALDLNLLHFLKDWLVNHIQVADRSYAKAHASSQKPSSALGRFFNRLF